MLSTVLGGGFLNLLIFRQEYFLLNIKAKHFDYLLQSRKARGGIISFFIALNLLLL